MLLAMAVIFMIDSNALRGEIMEMDCCLSLRLQFVHIRGEFYIVLGLSWCLEALWIMLVPRRRRICITSIESFEAVYGVNHLARRITGTSFSLDVTS